MHIYTGENNPILRKVAQEIHAFDIHLHDFIIALQKTMTQKQGVGLAAPQVGKSIRVFIMKDTDKHEREKMSRRDVEKAPILTVINPRIINVSKETMESEEGCLSLPNVWGKVLRYKSITAYFENEKGIPQTRNFNNFSAITFQHEFDHLEGRLFIDHI